MTINERMNHIIKELYGGNKRAFANAIGVSATVIENVVGTRQGKPSYDVLEKVCANANISAEWLLMERGEMLYNSTHILIDSPFIENKGFDITLAYRPVGIIRSCGITGCEYKGGKTKCDKLSYST